MTTWYEILDDGTIGRNVCDEQYAAECGLTLTTEREIVFGYDGKKYFSGEEPTRPVSPADYDRALENHLDTEKAERGYTRREPSDYSGSTNPRWAQDAVDWIAHRDEVMAYGLEIENKSAAGEPVPTLSEFIAALPVITWTYSGQS